MIVKVKKFPSNFIQIHKFPINEDTRLSWRAKGILTYLTGKDEDWNANLEDIAKHANDGINSVRSGMRELKKYGYAKVTAIRGERGKIVDWQWEVCEIPIYKSCPEVEIHILENSPIMKGIHPEVEIHVLAMDKTTRKRNSYSGKTPETSTNKASCPEYEKPHCGNSSLTKKERTKKDKNTKKEEKTKIKKPVFNEEEFMRAYTWATFLGTEDMGLLYDLWKCYPTDIRPVLKNIRKAPQAKQKLIELYRESQGGNGTPKQ